MAIGSRRFAEKYLATISRGARSSRSRRWPTPTQRSKFRATPSLEASNFEVLKREEGLRLEYVPHEAANEKTALADANIPRATGRRRDRRTASRADHRHLQANRGPGGQGCCLGPHTPRARRHHAR